MRRTIILFFGLLLVLPLSAQRVLKIPRRVYFREPAAIEGTTPQQTAIAEGTADMLSHAISTLQPILRTDIPEEAHNIVEVVIESTEGHLLLQVYLQEGGTDILRADHLLPSQDIDVFAFTDFISSTARLFAPRLGLVEPEIRIAEIEEEQRLSDIMEEEEFSGQLDKEWEITLWTSGWMRVYKDHLAEDPSLTAGRFSLAPIFLDGTFWYSRNSGVYLSLFMENSDFFSFDTVEKRHMDYVDESTGEEFTTWDRERKALSQNLYLLPGIGLCYRTLDKVAAQFHIGLHVGGVRLKGKDDLNSKERGGLVNEGEVRWIPYTLLSMGSGVVWNIQPDFALKLRMALNMDMWQFATMDDPRYGMDFSYNGLFFQFFSLGLGYRP